MMRRVLLAATPWVLGALACRADVRLERSLASDHVEVRITPTAYGPWTPLSDVGPDVLNPNGDIEGDSAPAVALSGATWLVAWNSPSNEALQLARATDRWQQITMVPTRDVVGTPLVVAVAGGWIVATRGADGRVSMAGCTSGCDAAASEMVDLGAGRLVGGRTSGADAQFVIVGRDGCIDVVGVRMVVPDPTPIDVYHRVVCLPRQDRLPFPGPLDPSDRPPPGGYCGHEGLAPPDGSPPHEGGGDCGSGSGGGHCGGGGSRCRRAAGDGAPVMRLIEVLQPDGSTTGLVTWTSHGRSGSLDLSEDGPMLPVTTSRTDRLGGTRRD